MLASVHFLMVFRGRLLMVCLLDGEIAAPKRSSLPSCSRPSRTLRAAGAVARRRAILDRRCARRHVARAGRDGRMAAIEQKDGAPGTRRRADIFGEVQGEEGFAALGFAADDPDRLLGPQPCDEPALVLGAIGKAPGGLDGQQVHRRRPAAALASAAGGAAHVSRNSFSSICRASRSAAYASNSPAMFMRARRLPWA